MTMLFTYYKTFKIKEIKLLLEMIITLTTLINELVSLGKTLNTEEQVNKVLRILPKSKWDVKVTVIREAKDIFIMTLDELVENLRIYEMNMKDLKNDKVIREKSLALKASDGEKSNLDEEQLTFLIKNFRKFLTKGKTCDSKEKLRKSGPMINLSLNVTTVKKLITWPKIAPNEKLSRGTKELKKN